MRIVGLFIKTVATTTKFACIVQFGSEFRVIGDAEESTHTHVATIELRHFRVAIARVIVRRTVVQLTKEGESDLVVVGDVGSIEVGGILKSVQTADTTNFV